MPLQPLPDYGIGLPDPSDALQNQLKTAMGFATLQQGNQLKASEIQVNDAQIQKLQAETVGAEQKAARQQQYQQRAAEVNRAPTADRYAALITDFPDQHEALKIAMERTDENEKKADLQVASDVHAAIGNNELGTAFRKAKEAAEAYKTAGNNKKAADMDRIAELVQSNPREAFGAAAQPLVLALGPKDYAKNYKELMLFRETEKKEAAEARRAVTLAKNEDLYGARKDLAEIGQKLAAGRASDAAADDNRSQIARRTALLPGEKEQQAANINELYSRADERDAKDPASQLELERRKVAVAERNAKNKEDMEARQAGKVAPSAVDYMNKTLTPAIHRANVLVKQTDDLVKKLDSVLTGGPLSRMGERFKTWYGSRDGKSQILDAYDRLRKGKVLEILGPLKGSTSDKDMAFAQEGEVPSTDNEKLMRSYVVGLNKLAKVDAQLNSAEKEWLSGNLGSTGTAVKDFMVHGIKVKKDDTFEKITEAILAPYLTAKPSAGAGPAAGSREAELLAELDRRKKAK